MIGFMNFPSVRDYYPRQAVAARWRAAVYIDPDAPGAVTRGIIGAPPVTELYPYRPMQ